MGNKITKMTPLNKTKYYLLGILMMVASVISVFAFTTHYTSPENSAVHTIAAASIEDWTQVYNYEVDSSTSTVTITGLKDDYAALDGLVIPSYIGGNPVKTIGNNAFASKSAKTVYFASNSQVTTIKEGAFSMYSLQYIQLPESLTTIWYNAFRNCSALKYLNIPKNLQYFGSTSDAAYGYLIHSKNLQYIDCDAANPYFTVVDNVLYTKDMKTLVLAPRSLTGEFTIPEGVERISNAAMIGMNNLTKINFPSTLKTIGNLFLADTSSVEEVILPDSVTRIDGYFLANNGGVKLVKLSNSISRIEDYSIYGCANLTSIVIPEGVTHIGAGCFTSMPSLSAVVLPTTIQSISANTFKNTNITHMQKPYDTFTAPADTFTNKNADTEIVWHDSDNMFDYTTFNRGNDILAQINGYTEEGKNVTGVRIPAMLGGYAVGRISTNWNSTGSRVVALAFTPSSTRLDIDYFSSEGSQVWYFPNNINHTSGMWGILGFARSSSKYLFVANDNPYMYSTPDGKFILSKDNVAGGGKRLIQAAHVWDTDTINLPDEVAIVDHYSMNLTDHKIKTINGLEHTTWVTGADTTGFAISGWEVEDLTIPFNYTYPDGSTTTAPTNLKTNYIGSSNALQTLRYEEGFETLTRAGARNCGNIKNVVLPKSLKLIKANAFKDNLPNLTTTILIPSGCTVEEGAFPSGVTLIYEDQINWENVYTYKTVENSEYGSQTPNGTIAITGLKSEYQGLRSVTIPSTIGGTNVTCVANLNYSTLCEINFASGSHITNFAGSAISDTNIIELTLPASYRGQYGLEISHPNLENNVLQNINVDPANTSLHSIDGVLYYSTGGTGAYLAKFPSGRTGEYTIPNSVTTLCNGAFGGSHLSTLYVPNNVTTMHQSVFNGSYIANIIFDENCNIPRTNTNNYYSYYADSNYARDGVAVPPNGITIISTCEYASTAFESIEIPATVTTIGTEAFRNNTHLKYLLFQGNTAVTIGSRAFVGCTSLPATVVVPDGSTWQSDSFPSNVTNVVFVSDLWKLSGSGQITPDLDKINTYTGLNTLIVPKTFNGTTITTYYGNGISLPNIGALVFVKDTEVTTIAQSSLPYSALKYMYLPDSLTTTTQFDVWSRAEGYTYPLTTLKLPNNLVLPVTTKLLDRGYAWNTGRSSRIVDMPNISEFVLSDDNPRYKLIDGNLYTLDGTTLVATVKNDTGIFTLPAGVTTIGTHAFYQSSFSHINLNNGSLTTIWDGAFAYCNNLISIALPSTITNLSNADSLFLGCAKLEHIEMPNNIALGGAKYMFSYTNTLKGFRYPDSSTASGTNSFYAAKIPFVLFNDGMTTISGATFHGTGLIETVTIPASVTSIVGSAFATSNVTLKNIYLNPNNTSFVIQNGILYSSNMKNLIRTSINAPENIVVPEGVEYIYQEAFDGHASTSITLPSTLRNLSSYAFTGSNFTEIVIPEGVTTIGGTVFNSIAATSVTLPSSVTIIKNGAFSSSNNLVNVTLSEGTTTIESKAFNGLRNLETVNLPSTITSIAGDAFYNCPKLQISTIPAVMTRIEDGAFKGNTAITSITIPNTVVYVGAEAFMNCTNLETVIFEAGSPLTTLGASVFSGCTKLKTITLPQSLVAIPQSCFDGDIKLTGVTMPTTVRDIEAYAFQGTSSLGAFTFHEGLQRILGQAFTNSGISGTIVLPSTLNTLSNPYNFQGCTKLTKVIFNNNILTTIETNTFKDCSNLAEVVLPTSITSIKAYAFANTPKLKTINLPTGAYSLGNYAFYNTGLETLYVHRNANIASEYAFAESKSLKTIEFVSDWRGRWSDSYGGTYFVDYTFQNCTALESVILPSTLVHTGMGMFQGCTKLSSVTGYDPEKLTYIENSTFSGCSSLEYFNLAYARTINSAAFQNCTSLTNIVSLNSFVSHGVRVFAGCTNLRMNITIPATAASAFTDKGTEMFNGSGITGLTFSEGITTIPANFAQNCANLTTVVLPSTITKIGSYAFYNCTNLSNINNLPDGLETIDSYAFYNCKEAFTQSITIPSSVVTIKNYAFYNCTPRLFDLSNASSLRYIYDYAFALSSTSNTPAYEQTLLLPDETNSSLELIRLPFRYQKITNEINLVFNSSAPTVYQPFRYAQYVPSVKIKNIAENANTNISGYFAFYSTRLKNVYFDASVRSIEPASTFAYSDSISTIYIDGAIGTAGRTGVVSFPWTSNTFNSSVNKSNINVFVAAADVDAYKADSYWSAFNILSHTATVSVSFHSLFGTAPAAQSVQVVSGRATNPGDLTCPEGYTFKGYYTYSDSVGYTRITDFSALVFYADTTIYCLWDIGNDIVNYLTFSTTTFNGVSGYAITGYTTNLKYFPDLVIPRQYNGKDILTINNNVFTYLYWLNSVDFVSNSNVMYFNSNAFYYCYNLTSFTFPSSINYISSNAIYYCDKLSIIYFRGNPNLDTFTANSYAWQNSLHITDFRLKESTNYVEENGIIYNSDFTTLYLVPKYNPNRVVTLPNSVKVIRNYAFYQSYNTRVINLNETIITHIYDYAFYMSSYSNRNGIMLNDGNVNFENLVYAGQYAFYGTNLYDVRFGDKVTTMSVELFWNSQLTSFYMYAPDTYVSLSSWLFESCYNLKSFTFVTSNTSLTSTMLANDYNLEYAEFGNITNMGSNTQYLSGLKTLRLGDYITSNFPTYNLRDGLNIIVKRANYNKWLTNSMGWNLSRFNIYPDEFDVTFQNDYDPANCYTEVHMYGDSDLTLPVVTVTKAEGLYDFIGWYYKNENNLSMPYTGQALLKDTTIFAVYDLPTEYLFSYEYDDENYTATVIAFDEADQFATGALVLPSRTQHNGETYRVIAVADEVFQGKTTISSITIPEGYVSIGDYAFEGARYLSRLTLPTSLQTIGAYAFANIGLTEYSEENRFSIYATTIGERAFSNAGNPHAILLGEGLTEIGDSAFENTKFYLCNFPDTLESIGTYAFAHTGIYWDGETVTNLNVSQAYDNGEYLEPNQNDGITFGANLRSIGQGAFKDNDGLYYVYCNDAIEYIGNYAFEQCYSLAYISLPTSMEYIGARAFQESNLYSVTIPYGVELGTNIFAHCYYLHDVTFRGGDITIPYSAFMGCENLISVTFGDGSYYIEDQAFRNDYKLQYLIGPDGTNSSLPITYIGNYAFTNSASQYKRYELTDRYSINMHLTNTYQFTQRFTSFFEEILGDLDATMPGTGYTLEQLLSMPDESKYSNFIIATFNTKEERDEVYESWINADNYWSYIDLKNPNIILDGNTLFENLYLPDIEYIGQYAFSESGIRNIRIGANLDTIYSYTFIESAVQNVVFDSYYDTETHNYVGVKNIYARAFEDTYNLDTFVTSNGLERINANAFFGSAIKEIYLSATVNRIAGGAFNNTKQLETIVVDSDNPIYKSYNNMLFYAPNTNDLNSLVYYPYALTPDDGIVDFRKDLQFRSLDTVYDYAFAYNDRINELYFPKGLKLIKENAFYNSYNMRWLQIPGTIEEIEEALYSGNYLFVDGMLDFEANVPQLIARAFRRYSGNSYYGSVNTNLTIYVPESDYDKYSSTVWGVFKLVPYDPEDKIVIITLELNGGSGTNTVPALLGLPLNVGANPVRSGYKFVGWFTDSELEDEYDMESIVENSFTLYAKWKPIEYSINYVMNGADKYADSYGYDPESFTFDEENDVLTQKTDYEYLVEGIQFVQPFMEGYNFIGWYRKDNFESELLKELDFEALTYRESTGDNPVTLYARFERIYYNVEFGEHEAYEINVIAGYSDPVEYGNSIKFTIVYHDGYTQNVDNQNIRLNVTTTSELKDDAAYREYYDIEDIEIGTSISYEEGLDEGIRIYTITSPVTDLSVAVEGIERNKYTISFAPNLSRFATGLGNMPEPIIVRHGDNLIEDSTNAEYKVVMYGTIEENGTTYVYDMLVDIFGYHRANLRIFKDKYDEIERSTSEFAYTLKTFDSYNDMMSTYQALLDATTLYSQIFTNNPSLRIETSISGISSVEISTPTVNGYTFKSWNLMVYDSVSGETTVASRSFNMNQAITRDITLAADWNLTQYDIILALNGGQIGSSESETSTIYYTIENGFTLPYNSDTIKQITRLGYSFGGWYEGERDDQGHYISDFTVGPIEYIEAGTYGNKIYVAKWDLNTYDIIYQLSNGGHFSPETIASPDYHDTYTVLSDFDLPDPLRVGYEFAGWYETPNYTGNMINHISPNTREGDLILYAKWTSVDYLVIYHLNGNHISEVEFDGSIINYSNNIVNQTYTYNEVNDIEIATEVSRNGYSFAGWYSEPELENRYNYIPAGTSGNIDVYAKWEAQEFTIVLDYVYDKNLLVDGTALPDTFRYTFDDLAINNSITIQPVSVSLLDNSQFFAGWQSGVNIYSTISAANSNIVKLTAIWRNQKFDIFMTSNDTYIMPGSSTPIPVTDIVKMVGEDGDITNTYGGSLRFMLYYTNKAFSKSTPTVTYRISSDITTADDPAWASVPLESLTPGVDHFYYIPEVNGNMKLYIDGLAVNYYTVHFLNADGTSIRDDQFVHGSTIQGVPSPSKDGYNFAGWYMDSGITVLYNVATPITGDLTLYARFALNEYVVTLKNGINNLTIDIPYSRQSEITFVPSTAPWEVEGYTAPLEYRIIDGSGTITTEIITSTVGRNGNFAVFAVYGLKEYTITYGVEQGVTHTNRTHYNITDAFALTAASRIGYTFNYWTDSEGRIVSNIAKGTTGDLTLSANFTLNSDNYVAVCYYDSYVKLGELAVYKGNVLHENEFTAPVKAGYTFVAWYVDEELTTLYTFGLTPMYQNLNLYAKYNLSSYNITYTYELYNAGTYVRAVSESRVHNINDSSFNVEDPFRFSNATSPGLKFLGWYVSGMPVVSTQNLNPANTQIVGRFDYVTYNIIYTIPEGMAEGIGDNVTSFNIDTPDITFNEPSGINPLFNFDHWANTIDMNDRVDGVYSGTVGDVYVTGVFVSIENYIVVEFYIGTNMETSSKITKGTNALRPVEPTKTGYVLDGWYYSSDCTGPKYDFLTYLYANTKLYAKWNLINYVLEVSYSRAPHHIPELPDTFNVTSIINLPVLEDLTGYAFTGWYEGNNKIQSIIGRSSDLSIIARFELVDYTISYEGVPQDLGLPTTYNVEGPAYIDISGFEPEKEGYNFVGWSILDGNSWVVLDNGKFSKMLAKNVFIRADFEFIPTTASLTLYLNGDLYLEQTVNIGEELELEEPTLAGYTFDGWYLSDDYTGDKIVVVTDSNPVNAYGRMLPITYTVTYDCNLEGVTLPAGNITSYSVNTPSFELISPSRVFGYTFDGWFTGAVLVDGVYNFDNATQISIIYQNNTDLQIVAKYTLTVYTITYQLGYGTNAPENVTTFTINSGIITLVAPIPPQDKAFSHWEYVDGEVAETWESFNAADIARNITLYARYNDLKTTNNISEIVILTGVIGGSILFFVIITYSIVGSIKRKRTADARRIEELLTTLTREQNSNKQQTSSYRDDFRI